MNPALSRGSWSGESPWCFSWERLEFHQEHVSHSQASPGSRVAPGGQRCIYSHIALRIFKVCIVLQL